MVRKLDSFYYDKSKWKVECDEEDELYLVRLSNSNRKYCLGSKFEISAINQISRNLFIVLDTKFHRLILYKIPNNGSIKEIGSVFYENSYSYDHSYEFWTDTIVLLHGRYVYDLASDEYVTRYFHVLDLLKKYNLSSILLKKKDNHEYLYCVKEIYSNNTRGGDFLQFVIDVETCKPVLPVYSTLRDHFIDLTDTFTFDTLLEEEKKYKEIVDANLIAISKAVGEKVLLSAFDED